METILSQMTEFMKVAFLGLGFVVSFQFFGFLSIYLFSFMRKGFQSIKF